MSAHTETARLQRQFDAAVDRNIECAAKRDRLEACLRSIAATKITPTTNHAELVALLVAMAKTELSR